MRSLQFQGNFILKPPHGKCGLFLKGPDCQAHRSPLVKYVIFQEQRVHQILWDRYIV